MKKLVESFDGTDIKVLKKIERYFKSLGLVLDPYTLFLYTEVYCVGKCSEDEFNSEISLDYEIRQHVNCGMVGSSMYGTNYLKGFIVEVKKFRLKFEKELISYLKDRQLTKDGLNLHNSFRGFGLDPGETPINLES